MMPRFLKVLAWTQLAFSTVWAAASITVVFCSLVILSALEALAQIARNTEKTP